ncbi:MAG: hypothetical protein ACLTYW_03500 [Collinsella sp.]
MPPKIGLTNRANMDMADCVFRSWHWCWAVCVCALLAHVLFV